VSTKHNSKAILYRSEWLLDQNEIVDLSTRYAWVFGIADAVVGMSFWASHKKHTLALLFLLMLLLLLLLV